MKKILAISGSSASVSINHALLEYAVGLLADRADVQVVSVRDMQAPLFSVDLEESPGVPQTIRDLHADISNADAVILASPEHNGSTPAMLKNTIDWLSRVKPLSKWLSKPLALISTSPGARGGATNLEHLATLAPRWGATVVGTFSLGQFTSSFDRVASEILNADDRARLGTLLENLASSN